MSLPLVSLARRLIPRALVPDIAIHGQHSASWHRALDPGARVWTVLGKAGIAQPAVGPARPWRKRVTVPLMEQHIATLPAGCHALVPDIRALTTLQDKALFARYAAEIGAADLLPRSIELSAPTFPAVLKRANLNAGQGVAFIDSQQQLDEKLARSPWVGEAVLLQEAIPAWVDYVTHVVCVGGRILWHVSYAYPLATRQKIRGSVDRLRIRRSRARPADLAAFERLLLPLGFDGPANIDYRRRADGSVVVLEINPRLGGSLMRPEHVRDLAGTLRMIVRHARWQPSGLRQPPV